MAAAPVRLAMWVHSGQGRERKVYQECMRVLNASQREVKVELTFLPEGSYDSQVQAAAFAGKLPALLEFDGPYLYNYAWSQSIIPLDGFPEIHSLMPDMLPTLVHQGTYRGRLYAVGLYESGLAIWGNRRLLAKAGVEIPGRLEDAWDLAAFQGVLARLKASGVPFPLDMKFNYGAGEWFSFGFAPIIQSFGGDLIDRSSYRTADGCINGPAAVKAMTLVQGWVRQGYVNAAARDDSDFIQGRSALSYVGHWAY